MPTEAAIGGAFLAAVGLAGGFTLGGGIGVAAGGAPALVLAPAGAVAGAIPGGVVVLHGFSVTQKGAGLTLNNAGNLVFAVTPGGPGSGTSAGGLTGGSGSPPGTPVPPRGRAPEFPGGRVTESGFLRATEQYLGTGYREVSPGRYLSADGLRQVRFGKHEVSGPGLHGHFEAYDRAGGAVIENTRVVIILD